jgi:hypothetical protein
MLIVENYPQDVRLSTIKGTLYTCLRRIMSNVINWLQKEIVLSV